MSFRSRLLLFFMIIVVVPMVAVALVLFSITADSETGKADAEIAQGMRAAFAVYDQSRDGAMEPVDRIARDPQLAVALAREDRDAVRRRLVELQRRQPTAKAIAAFDARRRPIASVGSRDAIAPAAAAPSLPGEGRVGLLTVSTTAADDYVRQVQRITGLDVRVAIDDRLAASTIEPGDRAPIRSGDVEIAGRDYRGRFASVEEPAGPDFRVGVFKEGADLSGAITDRRTLIGAILAAFLLLALLSSIVVVRALQRQINQFLQAAQRLGRGDFSEPVPVEGGDEFAALGNQFNAMSAQLAAKIEEVERKRAELEETIRRVGEAFAAGLDREGMVNLAVRTAVEACEAEIGRALPIDSRLIRASQVGELTSSLEAALEAAERQAFTIRTEDAGEWIAALEGTADDALGPRRPVRAHVDGVYAMSVPLVARLGRGRSAEQVGAISIARTTGDFDEQEYELFAYLTNQAAVSIENVDLHETVRRQAVTDELTGLFNLRHFHETLDSEIERSRRFGTEVGLAMMDIDDFKQINDTFGHQQGDLVLLEVGRVLRNLSRDIDEPARYGGEEMAVILPQTDVEGAALLAERMRAAIELLEIERLDGDGALRVTASFGVASLPVCARDKESLIAEADAALYRAKRAGKNRVERGEMVTAES